jgi:hypothetical protein
MAGPGSPRKRACPPVHPQHPRQRCSSPSLPSSLLPSPPHRLLEVAHVRVAVRHGAVRVRVACGPRGREGGGGARARVTRRHLEQSQSRAAATCFGRQGMAQARRGAAPPRLGPRRLSPAGRTSAPPPGSHGSARAASFLTCVLPDVAADLQHALQVLDGLQGGRSRRAARQRSTASRHEGPQRRHATRGPEGLPAAPCTPSARPQLPIRAVRRWCSRDLHSLPTWRYCDVMRHDAARPRCARRSWTCASAAGPRPPSGV